MCCWFCESEERKSEKGFYCPFEPCPAGKEDAGDSALDGPETERWRQLREEGRLEEELEKAGLPVTRRSVLGRPSARSGAGDGPG
jgi:hypothetical protein